MKFENRDNYKNVCGIYCIKNLINDRLYIGSSKNLYQRYIQHLNDLKRNKHCNTYLQNSWNKYGEDNFEFKVLEICDKQFRFEREQKYLDYYLNHTSFELYNSSLRTDYPSFKRDKDFIVQHPDFYLPLKKLEDVIYLLEETTIPWIKVAEIVEVPVNTVKDIYYKRTYKDIVKDLSFVERDSPGDCKRKLNKRSIEKIFEMYNNYISKEEIARFFKVTPMVIGLVLKKQTYKEYSKNLTLREDVKNTIGGKKVQKRNLLKKVVQEYDGLSIAARDNNTHRNYVLDRIQGVGITLNNYLWSYSDNQENLPSYIQILINYRDSRSVSSCVIRYNKDGVPELASDYINVDKKQRIKNKLQKEQVTYKENGYIYKLATKVPEEDIIYLIKQKYHLDDEGNYLPGYEPK